MEIHVLVWDRHNKCGGLNRLMDRPPNIPFLIIGNHTGVVMVQVLASIAVDYGHSLLDNW